MKWSHVIWDHLPDGNVEHVEEHGLTMEDVEFVLDNYDATGFSQSSGRPCVFGDLPDGRRVIVIYEEAEADTVAPVTAFEIQER